MKTLVSINFANTSEDGSKYLSKRLGGLSLVNHRLLLAGAVAFANLLVYVCKHKFKWIQLNRPYANLRIYNILGR